jgi:hypothetical protein
MITDQEDTSSSSSTTCSSSSSSSSSSLLCQRLDGSRIDDLWKRLEVDILGNSLPEMDFHRPPRNNLRSNASFVNMVTESFKYFTPERLQRSSLFPGAPLHDIMDILERKLSNASAEPLRVMVFGGSPTAGHGCNVLQRVSIVLTTGRITAAVLQGHPISHQGCTQAEGCS